LYSINRIFFDNDGNTSGVGIELFYYNELGETVPERRLRHAVEIRSNGLADHLDAQINAISALLTWTTSRTNQIRLEEERYGIDGTRPHTDTS
jgi:primosomal protein N''